MGDLSRQELIMQAADSGATIGAMFVLVIAICWNTFIIWFMNRASVKAQFAPALANPSPPQ